MTWGDLVFWPFRATWSLAYLVLGLIVLIFLIWMIVDCLQRKFKIKAEKWIWFVIMIVFTWIGAVLYYIFVRALNPKGVAKK